MTDWEKLECRLYNVEVALVMLIDLVGQDLPPAMAYEAQGIAGHLRSNSLPLGAFENSPSYTERG